MADSKYQLTYFGARAMGEPIRYMFIAADVKFDDNIVKLQDWQEVKPNTPFGQMPVLEVDGHKVGQSVAICRFLASRFGFLAETDVDRLKADAIVDTLISLRAPEIPIFVAYLAGNKEEMAKLASKYEAEQFPYLMEKLEMFLPDSDFVTGTKMTWADIFLASIIEFLVDGGKVFGYNVSVNSYPKIAAIQKRVFCDTKIAEYRKNRQAGEFDF